MENATISKTSVHDTFSDQGSMIETEKSLKPELDAHMPPINSHVEPEDISDSQAQNIQDQQIQQDHFEPLKDYETCPEYLEPNTDIINEDTLSVWFDFAQSYDFDQSIVDEILFRSILYSQDENIVVQIDPAYESMLTDYITQKLMSRVLSFPHNEQKQVQLIFKKPTDSPYERHIKAVEKMKQQTLEKINQSMMAQYLLTLGFEKRK